MPTVPHRARGDSMFGGVGRRINHPAFYRCLRDMDTRASVFNVALTIDQLF